MRKIVMVLLVIFASSCNYSDLSQYFNDFDGTIVIYNQNSDKYTIVNKIRARTRFSPCSTFKIPNSIIALETGIVSDVNQIVVWDTLKYAKEDWWPKTWIGKHNLKTAIKYSVVPFYRNIANQIGSERMQYYVTEFAYGNTDISSGIDNFWLSGSLKISAMEQVEFLRKFYNAKLSVSQLSIESVKSILIQESKGSYILSYKTGAGSTKGKSIGWLVGYVEKQENVFYFAMNIEGKTFEEVMAPRLEITKAILSKLDILD